MIDSIVKKSKFWIKFKKININDRQRKVINKMLDLYPKNFEGDMTNKKYSSITKSSSITAARDLSELCKNGLLLKGESGGRSTHYLINIEGLNKDIK
jgi:Fic family protein